MMTGAAIAQVMPIAVSPILTRLYSPADFGTLTLFISTIGVLASISTLRYELAIVQPDEEPDAVALLLLSLLISASISILIMLLIMMFSDRFSELFAVKGEAWLYCIPIGVFGSCAVQAIGYWHTRHQRFKYLSQSKIAQGIGTTVIQLGAALSHLGTGLILGYVGGIFISLYALYRKIIIEKNEIIRSISISSVRKNALNYSNFPKYSVFGALADNLSLQMPVFMLTKFFDAHVTGSFGLTFRVLNLPLFLIAASLSQVLYQRLAVMQHTAPDAVPKLIIKIFIILLSLMMPIIGIISLFGEPLFVFFFGEAWRFAGNMAGILIFAVAIRFAVNPLSSVLALNQNVRLGVIWQSIYFLTITSTLYLFSNTSINTFLKVFVAHEIILYILYLYFIFLGTKLRKRG